MESKKIYLRRTLTSTTLRYHLKRFFKLTTFTSEYIAIQTKYGDNKKQVPTESLGKYFYINLNNKGEVTYYIDHLCQEYRILKNINNKDFLKTCILSVNFIPTNKKEHENFLNELSKINPFKV